MKKLLVIMMMVFSMLAWGQSENSLYVFGTPMGTEIDNFKKQLISLGGIDTSEEIYGIKRISVSMPDSITGLNDCNIVINKENITSPIVFSVLISISPKGNAEDYIYFLSNIISAKYGSPNQIFENNDPKKIGNKSINAVSFKWNLQQGAIIIRKEEKPFGTNGYITHYVTITYYDYVALKKAFPSLFKML
ncbi:MAG: hypothetical protein ACI3Z7_05410 [Candidatus Aphodosoma sp.]